MSNNSTMVHLSNLVGAISEEEVKITEATSRVSRDSDCTGSVVVLNPPVLSLRKIGVHSEPTVISSLAHVERMSAVQVGAWKGTLLLWRWDVVRPQRVDAVLEEQLRAHRLSKSHHTLEISTCFRLNLRNDLVEIVVQNQALQVEDLDSTGTALNGHKRFSLLANRDPVGKGNRFGHVISLGVDDISGNLEWFFLAL